VRPSPFLFTSLLACFRQLSRWALVMLPQFAGLGLWPQGAPSVTASASAAALAPAAAASPAAVVAASALALPISRLPCSQLSVIGFVFMVINCKFSG